MKWCVVGFNVLKMRYEILSQWMKEQGFENTVDFIEVSPSEFTEKLIEIKKEYDQIRIESPYRNEVFLESKKNEAEMQMLRAADTFLKDSRGEWWLRSALHYGMNNILNSLDQNLNLEGSALIVGAGGGARAAIASLVKVGYQSFNITNAFDDQATELISELKKIYFGIEFRFVSQSQLVLLPGTNSVFVNTTPFSGNNEILDELHYFNFLSQKGLVWELTLEPIDTPLIKEAMEIGARIFRGYEFVIETEKHWLRWVAPGKEFSWDELRKVLLEKLKKEKVDSESRTKV